MKKLLQIYLYETTLTVRVEQFTSHTTLEYYVNGIFIEDWKDIKELYKDIFEVLVEDFYRNKIK